MDYQEIIDNLTDEKIMALLDRLEIPYINKETYILCKTACHNVNLDEASWKLYYYKNNHFFYCYSECQGMSIFNFLKHYYETRDIEYDWTHDIFNVVLDCSNYRLDGFRPSPYISLKEKYKKVNKNVELPEYNAGVLDTFIKQYPQEWLNDRISTQAMDKYNILYSIPQNKIIIPHLDVNGRLVGIRGRALDPEEMEVFGKYMPVKIENTWYSHPLSMNLYGLYENKQNIIDNHICYVFEAEKSVLQSESYSTPNCAVAVCGSQFNKFQLSLLMKHCRPSEIVICFDNEEKENEDKYFYKLKNICEKYKNYCNFSFIYDYKHLSNLKDSPSDNGEEIFRELVARRVKVRS